MKAMKYSRAQILAMAAFLLFLSLIGLAGFFTAHGLPLQGVDAFVFLPQTVSYQASGDLLNPVWQGGQHLDPAGLGRMTYHGFFFPQLLGALMPAATFPMMLLVLATLQGLASLLFCWVLYLCTKALGWRLTAWRLFLIALLGVVASPHIVSTEGRPEPLVACILLSALILMLKTPLRWHGRIAGGAIGLIAATSPISSVLAGLLFAGYAAWRLRARECLRETFGAAGLSLTVFAVCMYWYPYAFSDWLYGMWEMGNYALVTNPELQVESNYLYQYTFARSSPFLLGTLAIFLWTVFRFLRSGKRPQSFALFLLFLLLFVWAIDQFVLYVDWGRYNLLPYVPCALLAVYCELARTDGSALYRRVAVGVLLIASLGLPADVYLRAHAWLAGYDLMSARARFAEVLELYPDEPIALQQNLFTLTDTPAEIAFFNRTVPADATMIVWPQSYGYREQPPQIDAFELVADYFNPSRASIAGFEISKDDRGCGFAVYRRISGESSQ